VLVCNMHGSDVMIIQEILEYDVGNDCVPTPICFMESGFLDIPFQTFLYLFAIRKINQQKILFNEKKILS